MDKETKRVVNRTISDLDQLRAECDDMLREMEPLAVNSLAWEMMERADRDRKDEPEVHSLYLIFKLAWLALGEAQLRLFKDEEEPLSNIVLPGDEG